MYVMHVEACHEWLPQHYSVHSLHHPLKQPWVQSTLVLYFKEPGIFVSYEDNNHFKYSPLCSVFTIIDKEGNLCLSALRSASSCTNFFCAYIVDASEKHLISIFTFP